MPPPLAFDEGILLPAIDAEDIENLPFEGIPYITDRMPLENTGKKGKGRFYGNGRSPLLRVGFGEIERAEGKQTDASGNEEKRKKKIPIEVSKIKELGSLSGKLPYDFLTDSSLLDATPPVDADFADLINEGLATSPKKDIFIFVHGYKVVFDNPLLVAVEFWHFSGYQGVFVAYTWPSTPKGLAYFKDTETAKLSGQNLRLAVEYLAENTDAERINIIGYSAGTRVVITALEQLALIGQNESEQSLQEKYRIGHVAIISSDYDSDQFGMALANGLMKVPEKLTIYLSRYDEALSVSNLVFGQKRLGQYDKDDQISPTVQSWLESEKDIAFVDVSNSEKVRAGKGHGYFRKSPWVSSDILLAITRNLAPADRGLQRSNSGITWEFPDDYPNQMTESVSALPLSAKSEM